MKRILVTGGHGFIASYVIERLHELGYQPVVNVHHSQPNEILEKTKAIIYNVDVMDSAGMYGVIQHVDGVIHLAGLLGTSENIRAGRKMNDVNINSMLNVLDACDNFSVPCVAIGVGNHWMKNTYSISKTTAENYAIMYAREFGTKVNIVRALNACGPRQKWGKIKKITPTLVNKVLHKEPIEVYGGKDHCSIMDMIYVGDIANVLVDVLLKTMSGELAPGQIFQAGTGIGLTVWDIAEKVVNVCKNKGIEVLENPILDVPMRPGESTRMIMEDFQVPKKSHKAILDCFEFKGERAEVVADDPYHLTWGKELPKLKSFDEVLDMTIDYYISKL